MSRETRLGKELVFLNKIQYSEIDFKLTENELQQLERLIDNSNTTPEARVDSLKDVNFEVQRCIARMMSLQLLLDDNIKAAYKLFMQAQPAETALTFPQFKMLAATAKQLPQDILATQHTIAFLTLSDEAKVAFKDLLSQEQLSDSEQFLTGMCPHLLEKPELMPATQDPPLAQREKLSMAFLDNTHLRHILFTEGGASMFANLRKLIKKTPLFDRGNLQEQFNQLWVMRWRVNLFGFAAGPYAKYYTQTTHELFELVVGELNQLFRNDHYNPLTGYLNRRAEMAGYKPIGPIAPGPSLLQGGASSLTEDQMKLHKQFFGHLVALFDITSSEEGAKVLTGLNKHLMRQDNKVELLKRYDDFLRNEKAKTPTYTPAIYKTAAQILQELGHPNHVELATEFTCQVLTALHRLNLEERIYPCRDLAWKGNLKKIIPRWLESDNHLTCMPNPEKNFEMTPEYMLASVKTLAHI